MQHSTGTFRGLDGISIFTQRWQPEGPPRAAILLAHGYGEHSGRYAHVAAHLVAHGYAVWALDHRGHGRSGGLRTRVRDLDDYVTDLRAYAQHVRANLPVTPQVLYGHSMGSLIALLYAQRWQDELAGLITTGTALKLAGVNSALATMVRVLHALRIGGPLAPALAAEGISRDPAVVAAYCADPLVYRGRMRLGMAAALVRGAQRATRALPALRLPYLALHGGADPLTLPEGARTVQERSGAPDTTVIVYDGLRHEVHNEPEQARVLGDITAWLDARIPVRA